MDRLYNDADLDARLNVVLSKIVELEEQIYAAGEGDVLIVE